MKKKKKKASKILQMQIKERIKGIEKSKDKLSKELLEKTQIILAHLEKEKRGLKRFKKDLNYFLNGDHGDLSVKIVREQRMEEKINSMIREGEELKKKICNPSE